MVAMGSVGLLRSLDAYVNGFVEVRWLWCSHGTSRRRGDSLCVALGKRLLGSADRRIASAWTADVTPGRSSLGARLGPDSHVRFSVTAALGSRDGVRRVVGPNLDAGAKGTKMSLCFGLSRVGWMGHELSMATRENA